jgi:hypothetical protein
MKNKIQLTVLAIFAAILLIGMPGCQKYPDGPMISLKSRTERVSNTWKVDNVTKNGNDYTSFVTGYEETFKTNGDYSFEWGLFSGTGTWSFQNNDEEIRVIGVDNQSTQTLYILKLEEKQFWYYIMDGDDKTEFHMIEK